MNGVPAFIIRRQLALFDQVDKAYGLVVRDELKRARIAHEESVAA